MNNYEYIKLTRCPINTNQSGPTFVYIKDNTEIVLISEEPGNILTNTQPHTKLTLSLLSGIEVIHVRETPKEIFELFDEGERQ